MVLQPNIAGKWFIPRYFVADIQVDDLLSVEFDLEMVALADDHHLIPSAERFRRIFLGCLDSNHPTTIVRRKWFFFFVRIKYLNLETLIDGIVFVLDAQKYAAVTFFGNFIFKLQHKILIRFVRPEIVCVPLPALFPRARSDN